MKNIIYEYVDVQDKMKTSTILIAKKLKNSWKNMEMITKLILEKFICVVVKGILLITRHSNSNF
jgi:hypothetical protein